MIPLPKPRGFWDYALFALMMTGLLVLLFWMDASNGIGWADAAVAVAAAVLFVGLPAVINAPTSTLRWMTVPAKGAVTRSNDCISWSRWRS